LSKIARSLEILGVVAVGTIIALLAAPNDEPALPSLAIGVFLGCLGGAYWYFVRRVEDRAKVRRGGARPRHELPYGLLLAATFLAVLLVGLILGIRYDAIWLAVAIGIPVAAGVDLVLWLTWKLGRRDLEQGGFKW
jgi:hypothetical protein